eukprot:Nitzschia sp. Nitz4//scaffold394_size11837//6449//7204//NITZ4_009027-RA/size11837-processed-gene-0.18-mRNA-1//-1//CDS//3329550239//9082//frame0
MTTTMTTTTRRWAHTIRPPNKASRDAIVTKVLDEDRPIVEETMDWLENVVIGMNLCPFADSSWKSHQIHLEVIAGRDVEDVVQRVIGECLIKTRDKPGTSLMICPELFPDDFEAFLEIYQMLVEGALEELELTDDIQVAMFHPLFQFDGTEKEDVENHTNRSPFPIFHVLREVEVGKAVDHLGGDASKVWGRNVDLMHTLGEKLTDASQLDSVLKGRSLSPELLEQVQKILKEFHEARRKQRSDSASSNDP